MANKDSKSDEKRPLTCGIVMPISPIDGCTADHWSEVKNIICESVESIAEPAFSVRLVSDSDDVGVIQKRIVQNVYRNPNASISEIIHSDEAHSEIEMLIDAPRHFRGPTEFRDILGDVLKEALRIEGRE
jgi:hypothetical protein